MRGILIVVLCAAVLFAGACADEPDVEPAGSDDSITTDGSDFDTLDANGDSSLDGDEVAEWVDDTGVFENWDVDSDSELSRDEIADNTFELWDEDADGTISEEEWETTTDVFFPQEEDVIVYQDLDSDGDSEVDADEFAESFDFSLLGESWAVDSFDEDTFDDAYFELYDADDDGELTQSEWEAASSGLEA